jgi:hypothetical protein
MGRTKNNFAARLAPKRTMTWGKKKKAKSGFLLSRKEHIKKTD